jgi:hypothetical protein
MDLSKLDVRAQAAKPAEIELVHPVTKKPLGIFWRTIGRDADEYRRHAFAQADARNEAQAQMRAKNKHAVEEFTAQSMYDEQVQDLVFLARGWRDGEEEGVFNEGEKKLEYSADSADYVLRKYPWIHEQVAAGVGNRAVFMPASALN